MSLLQPLRAKSNVKVITRQLTFFRRRECNTQIGVYIIKNLTIITGLLYFPVRIDLGVRHCCLCRRLNVMFNLEM